MYLLPGCSHTFDHSLPLECQCFPPAHAPLFQQPVDHMLAGLAPLIVTEENTLHPSLYPDFVIIFESVVLYSNLSSWSRDLGRQNSIRLCGHVTRLPLSITFTFRD